MIPEGASPRYLNRDLTCSPPRMAFIDVCNLCSLRCPFCPTGRREKAFRHQILTAERFARLLGKITPAVGAVGLHNWGEPFLNPHLLEIVSAAVRAGMETHADSNFNFPALDSAAAQRLLTSGIRSLTASIDGVSQAAYGSYRVGGNLKLALHNLRLLAETRARLGAPVELVWKFLVYRRNQHELEAAARMAREIGVPIVFQLLSTYGDPQWLSSLHARADRLPLGEPLKIALSDREYPVAWHNHVPTSRYLGLRELSLDGRPPPERSFPLRIEDLVLHPRLPWCCRHPFEIVFINTDGSVTPCCTAWGDGMSLGNLFEQTLEEVWNGPAMRACREFLLDPFSGGQMRSVCQSPSCEVLGMALGRK